MSSNAIAFSLDDDEEWEQNQTDYDVTYELERHSNDQKVLHIFNQIKCDGYGERFGTVYDAKSLQKTFEAKGFRVFVHNDKTLIEIKDILDKFSDQRTANFTDYGCIAVAVLTHGWYNGELRAKDTNYNEQMIIDYLKTSTNRTFIDKPRIVIIQACRGENDSCGVGVHQSTGTLEQSNLDHDCQCHYTLNLEPDMLVLHSSYIGKSSFRPGTGSWFIQTLCKEIDKSASTTDLKSIITTVKCKVAIDKTHEDTIDRKRAGKTGNVWLERVTIYNKQMPMSSSTLTKTLFLRKYQGEQSVNEVSPIDKACDSILLCFYNVVEFIRTCCYLRRRQRHFDSEPNIALLNRARKN
ncbi:caspase-7-like [Achroia grisella]|uniref:caspase-7-like n=1 Tax=Achroia grisella TaxID=688607 RepID=UPI0027D2DBDD|nr:caspase-7-like [Achroia grisella]